MNGLLLRLHARRHTKINAHFDAPAPFCQGFPPFIASSIARFIARLLARACWRRALPVITLATMLAMVGCVAMTYPVPEPGRHAATVAFSTCYDGDTCSFFDTRATTVRLAAIDAPEMLGQQRGAKPARDALRTLVQNRIVYLVSYGRDRYNRWLAEIFLDPQQTQSVNLFLVTRGLVQVYRGARSLPSHRSPLFLKAERAARLAGRGIWSLPGRISPSSFRKTAVFQAARKANWANSP